MIWIMKIVEILKGPNYVCEYIIALHSHHEVKRKKISVKVRKIKLSQWFCES